MVNMLFSLYNFHEAWANTEVKKYIHDSDRVLIIPFSFGDKIKNDEDFQKAYNKINGKYYKDVIMPFLHYGVKEENIDWINYFIDTKEDAKSKLNNSDIVFFTGGLPDKMMHRINEFDIAHDLENFQGTIIGSSAGAMIQLADYHITPDDDYDAFSYNKGLNIINDFGIEVHYEGSEVQKQYIAKVIKEKNKMVYGIKNSGGIIVDKKTTTVTLLGDVDIFR